VCQCRAPEQRRRAILNPCANAAHLNKDDELF
jgi:hypothetical protein